MKNILKKLKTKKGVTYVELIVIFSIFSVVAAIVVFNYRGFQEKVDIKNLANDIALKFVEAQKNSLFGDLHPLGSSTWKPSYGVYFDLTAGLNTGDETFYYFADLDQDKIFDYGVYGCPVNECIEKFNITKGNYISNIEVFYEDMTSDVMTSDLNIVFTRPNSGPVISSTEIITPLPSPISYAEITVSSADQLFAVPIKVYTSGRIETN